MRSMTPIRVVLAALMLVCSLAANIGPPMVSYTVSGTSGDYTLDFAVNNNTNLDLFFFGVLLSSRNITGSPPNFNPNNYLSWNNSTPYNYGGSDITYNNNWIVDDNIAPPPGSTTSGFDVTVSDAVAPTSMNWFAYAYAGGAVYTGSGNFFLDNEPGFEGVASAATPEPSYLAVGAGIIGLTGFRKLRIKQQQSR